MATVTSFESLPHPSRSELRQFAELFAPLFSASSEESRRLSVAALSQCETVPPVVAFFIASQPIAVAAPFLIASPCLTNDALIAIARTQGLDHARAISRRERLSPIVLDALVGMRYDSSIRRRVSEADMPRDVPPATSQAATQAPGGMPHAASLTAYNTASLTTPRAEPDTMPSALQPAAVQQPITPDAGDRRAREDQLRRRIKLLAGHQDRAPDDRLGFRQVSEMQSALMVRFARNRETSLFCGVLADALSASHWLAERIMLDISGHQLATTLKGLFMDGTDAVFILERIYSHLIADQHGRSLAAAMWEALDADQCGMRLEAWRRADSYTHADTRPQAQLPPEIVAEKTFEPVLRPLRTSASVRRSVRGR